MTAFKYAGLRSHAGLPSRGSRRLAEKVAAAELAHLAPEAALARILRWLDDEYAAFADGYHAPRRLQCGDLNATEVSGLVTRGLVFWPGEPAEEGEAGEAESASAGAGAGGGESGGGGALGAEGAEEGREWIKAEEDVPEAEATQDEGRGMEAAASVDADRRAGPGGGPTGGADDEAADRGRSPVGQPAAGGRLKLQLPRRTVFQATPGRTASPAAPAVAPGTATDQESQGGVADVPRAVPQTEDVQQAVLRPETDGDGGSMTSL